jgi:acetyl esterase/lipase
LNARTNRSIRARLVRWILLPAVVLLFICSLLAFVSAPTAWLWIAAIVVGEWGHYLALACGAIAVIAFGAGRGGLTTAVLATVTAIVCLSPSWRASRISQSLPTRCTEAFGRMSGAAKPFDPLMLFGGTRSLAVTVTEHEYARPDRKSLSLDLYRLAAAAEPQPLIVIIHGGSWNGGSKSRLPAMNRWLAAQRYTVAAINYRHAPKWHFPAPVDDVFFAIDYLRANAQQLRIDPTRIVLVGRSAGGQLALSAAYSGRDAAIRGAVGFYAPTDLVLGYEKPSRRWVLDSKKALDEYLGGSPTEKPDAYAAASPLRQVNAATPPTLLIHGELDPIVWPVHSELLSARLQESGRPSLYLSLPWATHGCDANISGPSGQLSLYAISRFLEAVFETAADQR